MGDFNRYFICHGDLTTAGGIVNATGSHMPIYGRSVALEGDSVQCPACKSTGHIQCAPPMRPITGHANKQLSVGGDLCICGCQPPPRLIASQNQASAGFSAAEVATTSGASAWLAHVGGDLVAHGYTFDRFVVIKDEAGHPVRNIPYRITLADGKQIEGITNEAGQTQKVFSTTAQTATIEAPYYGNPTHTANATHGSDTCSC